MREPGLESPQPAGMSRAIPHLDTRDQAALDDVVARLVRRYGRQLVEVTLFGSKARGDAGPESDLDLLIVIRGAEGTLAEQWWAVADLTAEVEIAHGIALSFLLKDEAGISAMRRRRPLLVREIERDGIALWTLRPDATT